MVRLQFSSTNNISSFLIRQFTWSDYSHVDILLDDNSRLGSEFKGGVAIRPNEPDRFTRRLIVEVDASIDVITAARQQIGKKYDVSAIFGLIHRRNWEQDDKWFCSELVAYAFKRAGYPLLNAYDKYWRITPRDLLLSPYLKQV